MSDTSHCHCHRKEIHDHSSHDKVDIRETSPPSLTIVQPAYAMSAGAASTSAYVAHS